MQRFTRPPPLNIVLKRLPEKKCKQIETRRNDKGEMGTKSSEEGRFMRISHTDRDEAPVDL